MYDVSNKINSMNQEICQIAVIKELHNTFKFSVVQNSLFSKPIYYFTVRKITWHLEQLTLTCWCMCIHVCPKPREENGDGTVCSVAIPPVGPFSLSLCFSCSFSRQHKVPYDKNRKKNLKSFCPQLSTLGQRLTLP